VAGSFASSAVSTVGILLASGSASFYSFASSRASGFASF
jgi:hypothetical protein